MMIRNRCLWWPLLIASAALLAIPAAQSKPPQAAKKKAKPVAAEASPAPEASPALEPKAIEILKTASSQGHPLSLTTKSEVTLQRPDKLRVIMSADGPASEFYYNGKKMMAYA